MYKKHRINWTKGMRLTEKVFTDADDFYDEQLVKLRRLFTNGHYGLVGRDFYFEDAGINNNKFQVKKMICQAVTPTGHFIDIDTEQAFKDSENNPQREIVIPQGEHELGLFVRIEPSQKVMFGTHNPEEQIYRFPYCEPRYELFFASLQSDYSDACLIAKFTNQITSMEEDMAFIPPCVAIYSHNALIKIFHEFKRFVVELIQVVAEKRHDKEYGDLLRLMLSSLMPLQIELDNQFENKAPLELFVVMKKAVSSFSVACMATDIEYEDAEEERRMRSFIDKAYNHHDIHDCLTEGLQLMAIIYRKLSNIEALEVEEEIIEEPEEEPVTPAKPRPKRIEI